MCSRYVLASKIEAIEKRFDVECRLKTNYKPSYNVSAGKRAWVISSDHPRELVPMVFGYTAIGSKHQSLIVNARAEGNKNKTDDPTYSGGSAIIFDPVFRQSVRQKRCLVIADGFYECSASKGLDEPYLVYLRDKKRPFAFAGVWEAWTHPQTHERVYGFAIMTTVANGLLARIGAKRLPVILNSSHERTWLNRDKQLNKVLPLLRTYPSQHMDAYQVSAAVKNSENDHKDLVNQTGKRFGEAKERLDLQIIQHETLMRKEQVNTKRPQTKRDNELIIKLKDLLEQRDRYENLDLMF
jgi:putative SOS response-associated peptidase YedK